MIYIANKTLMAIHNKMVADQGSLFRYWEGKVFPYLDDAFRESEEPFRTHMGASLIGGDCARAVWYGWHWITRPEHSARLLRLFNRGHLEEARFIAMLLTIGCRVLNQDANGKQFRVSDAWGHFGGSGDGKAIGLPDIKGNDQICLLEFKTHGDTSFKSLAGPNWDKYLEALYAGKPCKFDGKGVKESKPQHYRQMQIYMRKMGVPVCLYAAVNKNNDDIYMEIVVLDEITADQYIDLAINLVSSDKPPVRINRSPGYYKCKWCDHKLVCHMGANPDRNCRTCTFAEPVREGSKGEWLCKHTGEILSKEKQFVGCSEYTINNSIYD